MEGIFALGTTFQDDVADGTESVGAVVVSTTVSVVACYEYAEQTFQAPEDMCTNDYGVVDYPRALATLANDAYVSVITEYGSESWPTESYEISASDLQKFVNDEPVEGKPSKYDYVPYPYLFTITDGKVTRAEQVWVP